MTKEIYDLLISIKDKLHNFDDDKPAEIAKLYKMQYLEHYHYSKDGKSVFAWRLTDNAVKELEEYEKSLRVENREIQNVELSIEANQISKQALKKSGRANLISLFSFLASLGAVVVAIIALCLKLN